MDREELILKFKMKLEQVRRCQQISASPMEDWHLISCVMDTNTHFISHEVIYGDIKDSLFQASIFTRRELEEAESLGQGSIDTMVNICKCTQRRPLPDFISFVKVLTEDHFHVAEKLMQTLESLIITNGAPTPIVTSHCAPTQTRPLAEATPFKVPSHSNLNHRLPSLQISSTLPGAKVTPHHSTDNLYSSRSSNRSNSNDSNNTSGSSSHNLRGKATNVNLFSSNNSEYSSSNSSTFTSTINANSSGHFPGSAKHAKFLSPQPAPQQGTSSGLQEMPSPLSPPPNQSPVSTTSSPLSDESANSGILTSYSYTGPSQTALQTTSFTAQMSEVYSMSANPRGTALIINNENFHHWGRRIGSSMDVTMLYNMFKYLGFQVRTEPDKTAEEMKALLMKLSQHQSLYTTSSLAVAVLSHGGANDCLFGTDGLTRDGIPVPGTFLTKLDIIHMFKGSACRAMEGKPKLFILQACRGPEENPTEMDCAFSTSAVPAASMREDAPGPHGHLAASNVSLPTRTMTGIRPGADHSQRLRCDSGMSPRPCRPADTADMCFVHSSSYGHKAYRTRDKGSPFISVFTQTVQQLAHRVEFRDIIQKVQVHFNSRPLPNNMMTLPDFSLQLMKKWFLNPPPLRILGMN